MFKKVISLSLICASLGLFADGLAPNVTPSSTELESYEPQPEEGWNKFNYVSLGIFSLGVGQRMSQGNIGFEYSISGATLIILSGIGVNGSLLAYLGDSKPGDRPYLGLSGSFGLGYLSYHETKVLSPFTVGQILLGYEYRNKKGNPRFFDVGIVPYRLGFSLRYGISF